MSLRPLFCSILLALSTPAFAAPKVCPDDTDRATFSAFQAQIAAAESPDAARELALSQTRLGHKAISKVARMLPRNAEIAAIEARLVAFEAGVALATDQGQVAGQFGALTQQSGAGGRCDYTTVEVLVIVIGFVLGILPGILFLFLFC